MKRFVLPCLPSIEFYIVLMAFVMPIKVTQSACMCMENLFYFLIDLLVFIIGDIVSEGI